MFENAMPWSVEQCLDKQFLSIYRWMRSKLKIGTDWTNVLTRSRPFTILGSLPCMGIVARVVKSIHTRFTDTALSYR